MDDDASKPWLQDYPVLLVDDEPPNLLVMKMALRDRFTVLTARSADEALDVLAHCPIAVLVTDQRMPGLSGTELCEIACAEYPDVYRIIVTAYAGRGSESGVQQCARRASA